MIPGLNFFLRLAAFFAKPANQWPLTVFPSPFVKVYIALRQTTFPSRIFNPLFLPLCHFCIDFAGDPKCFSLRFFLSCTPSLNSNFLFTDFVFIFLFCPPEILRHVRLGQWRAIFTDVYLTLQDESLFFSRPFLPFLQTPFLFLWPGYMRRIRPTSLS